MQQTSEAKKDYFDYLENVLGIKTILDHSPAPLFAKTELLICVENYQTYGRAEIDLLQKMVAALKVDAARTIIADLKQQSQIAKRVTIVFKDQPGGFQPGVFQPEGELTVQTYSPRVLVQKPQLKKIAWTELQKVLQFFASTSTEV